MNYIGIDLGGTRIKIGLQRDDKIIAFQIINSESFRGLKFHLPKIDDVIEKMMKENGLSSLDGIGIAFPGIVDIKRKAIISTNKKYDDAPELDLEHYYKNRWNIPFFIDNDARMAAVGEWKYGAGRSYEDIVMVTLGTGIGTSVIIKGNILRGKHFQAGCLGGHFVINYKGNECTCGNIGCVESEAASWNLEDQVKSQNGFNLSTLSKKGRINFEAVFQAARQGDKLAIRVKDNCLRAWSAGIISYIHAFDPEIIIMGGGVLNSAGDIIPYLQQQVNELAWTPWGEVKITKARLGDYSAIYGTIYSLAHEFSDKPEEYY